MSEHRITIDLETGEFGAIYSDDMKQYFDDLSDKPTIRRASDVEPAAVLADTGLETDGWAASIREWVTGQPKLVLGPFPTRAEALDAEVAYLNSVL